jgi:hypothetical protein
MSNAIYYVGNSQMARAIAIGSVEFSFVVALFKQVDGIPERELEWSEDYLKGPMKNALQNLGRRKLACQDAGPEQHLSNALRAS